jgi:Fur family ferric uptake transcriptional regulator
MANKDLLKKFRDILRREGLKYTPQRVAVLEEIVRDSGHRECEDIYMALRQNGSYVSRATIYRTIDILVKNEFVRKMEFGDGRARYESKVDSSHHDHMICTSCGEILEFVDHNIEDIQDKIAKRYHFKLQRHIHQLFGLCKKCR